MYDFHTHFIPADVLTWLKDNKTTVNAKWVKKAPDKEDFLSINEKWAFELKTQFVDTNVYLKEKNEAGVSHSIISPIPQLFLYDFSSDITKELAGVYNQSLAAWCRQHPDQLSGLATLPLNDPKQAAVELRNAMNLGLKGAIIGPGYRDYMLTNEFFTPFWEEANALGAIIFIHPLLCEDKRLNQRMMPNLIGVPWETTVCATDILLSGMLDTYNHVKILLAHGGGFMPYQVGRLDKGYDMWPAVSNQLKKKPSEYLKDFWYDNVLWNTDSLDYLTKLVGEDRVVAGSDFPFDLCTWPPAADFTKGAETLLHRK